MQRGSDGAVVPVGGVGHDGGQRHAGRLRPMHQRQRQAPFFMEPDRRRNPRRRAPRRIGGPCGGQIQRGAHRPGALARPERGGDGDLAIGHLAQRAAILPRHAHRMRPRFREARFVEDQNPRALRHHRPQPPPHDLGVPGRMRNEVLKGLVRRRLADPFEHRRHRLARAVAQQAVDILAQRHVLRAMAEAVLELIQPARQSSQQRPRGSIEHWGAAYRTSAKCTMSSIQITRRFPRESAK